MPCLPACLGSLRMRVESIQHTPLPHTPHIPCRRDVGKNCMELRSGTHAEHCTTWLKVSGSFQPTVKRLGAALEQTTVSLAFSLDGQAPTQQQVFAFLPLRSYGLKFIVQVSGGTWPWWAAKYTVLCRCIKLARHCGVPSFA